MGPGGTGGGQAIIRQASLNQAQGQGFPAAAPSATQGCPRQLILGAFFDGTNNNMYRDFEGVIGEGKETNVARLYKLYKEGDEPLKIREKVYVVGVGAMTRAAGDGLAGEMRTQADRREVQSLSSAERGSSLPFVGDIAGLATGLGGQARLEIAYRWAQSWCRSVPACEAKIIDVYGFSRGAAMARTFVNLCNIGLKREFERVSVRFLGVFDTVGSFGKAGDDTDVGQNMHIGPGDAAVVRHFTARHEIRKNFPLTSIGGADRQYPGAHSDVGGGYEKRDSDGVGNRLAFVPLADMYRASIQALVEMDPLRIPVDVDITQIRTLARECYSPSALMYDSDGKFIQRPGALGARQKAFYERYVHKSHASWSLSNSPDEGGRRRIFPNPRRKAVRRNPPSYQWVED